MHLLRLRLVYGITQPPQDDKTTFVKTAKQINYQFFNYYAQASEASGASL